VVKLAQLQRSGFSCGKNRCNGSVPVPTLTQNRSSVLEPLLTLIIDSLSNLASSDDEEDGEDENDNEDTEVGKLSEDDEPGWVMGTISKTVRHSMDSVCQKEVTLDELMQPGWVDRADYFHRRDKKYVMAEKSVLAVVKPQTDTTAASPSPTIFGNLI